MYRLKLTRHDGIRLISAKRVLRLSREVLADYCHGFKFPSGSNPDAYGFTQPVLTPRTSEFLKQIQESERRESGKEFASHEISVVLYLIACWNEQYELRNISNNYLRQTLQAVAGKRALVEPIEGMPCDELGLCACCGYASITGADSLCPVCHWEGVSRDPDDRDPSNGITLREARQNFGNTSTMYISPHPDILSDQDRLLMYEQPQGWESLRAEPCTLDFDNHEHPLATIEQAIQSLAAHETMSMSAAEMCDFIHQAEKPNPQDIEYYLYSDAVLHKIIHLRLEPDAIEPACYFWAQSSLICKYAALEHERLFALLKSIHADAEELIQL